MTTEVELNDDERALVTKVKRKKETTIADLTEVLKPKRTQEDKTSRVRNALRRPVRLGLIKQVGRGTYAAGNGKPPRRKPKTEAKPKANGHANPRDIRRGLIPDKELDVKQQQAANVAVAAALLGDSKQATKIATQLGYSRGKVLGILRKLDLKKLPGKPTKTWLASVIG